MITITWITELIRNYIATSPENSLKNSTNERAWAEPLVGFARGDDPLFEQFRETVGPFHQTPGELFAASFPASTVDPAELTVISWILPQTEESKKANRREDRYPAENWVRARIFGEEVNCALRTYVRISFATAGIAAVEPKWDRQTSVVFGRSSTWSERHIAYTAGLGTFGLCDGLISPLGKAMRCGSLVARICLPATERPYQDHQAYCLFFARGICRKCAERCPAAAISDAGHDKGRCHSYIHPMIDDYVASRFGFKGHGCGLCQTSVPCESRNPMETRGVP